MSDEPLELRAAPTGRNGTVTLSAWFNGVPIAVEKIDVVKSDKREAFAKSLRTKCPGIDEADLHRQLLKLAADHARKSAAPATDGKARKSNADLLAETPDDVKRAALQRLESPDLLKGILDDVAALGVAGERELVATTYLVGTSRLLSHPLAMIAQGPSSSGKSYCISKTASLFPAEAIVVATQLTPQALFYMPAGDLEHRFVVVGERSRLENDDTAEATRSLREMLSAGRLSKLVTTKINGEMKSVLIEQEGPIAYAESTTLTMPFNEDANRCIILGTDERPEQTRRIISKLAAACSGTTKPVDAERIHTLHHAMQRVLEARDVVIPFAERLGDLFQSLRVEARRAFPHLLSLIQASAFLHQRQRPLDADGRLLAALDDYAIARRLLAKPFGRQLGGNVSDGALRFHDRLRSRANGSTFTTSEAAKAEAIENSDRSVRGWLHELADAGGVELVEPAKGPKAATWRLIDVELGDGGASILPAPERLSTEERFRLSG